MQNSPIASQQSSDSPVITVPLGTPLSVVERELILSTLEHCRGERKRTAQMLGICTKTLYNRLREYGIRDEEGRAAARTGLQPAATGDEPRATIPEVPRNCATASSGSAKPASVETA